MSAGTVLFLDDQVHADKTTASFTVVSTAAPGFFADAMRRTDFKTGWKPKDLQSSDQTVRVDGGSTTWLGNVGDTVYIAVAYDARGSVQDRLNLRYYPNDDGLGASTIVSFVLNKTRPTVDFSTFTVQAGSNSLPKRYYELAQKQADRTLIANIVSDTSMSPGSPTITSAGGNFGPVNVGDFVSGTGIPANTYVITKYSNMLMDISNNCTLGGTFAITFSGGPLAIVHAWAMFKPAGVFDLDASYPAEGDEGASFQDVDGAGILDLPTAGVSNRNAANYQEFDLQMPRTSLSFWGALRDQMYAFHGRNRAFWMQRQGIRNDAKANFGMVRLGDVRRPATWRAIDRYDVTFRIRTEAGF